MVCLFTDASNKVWGAILTQVTVEDFESGSSPTLWAHEPFGFLSGQFRGAQLRWGIPDREGYAISISCEKFAHLLIRERGFVIFTDHRNLTYIFNPSGAVSNMAKPQADCLERWAMFLRCFSYNVVHIEGGNNVWADMLSRLGAAGSSALADKKKSQEVQVVERAARATLRVRQDRFLTAEAHTESRRADSEYQVGDNEERWPLIDEIRAAQD